MQIISTTFTEAVDGVGDALRVFEDFLLPCVLEDLVFVAFPVFASPGGILRGLGAEAGGALRSRAGVKRPLIPTFTKNSK